MKSLLRIAGKELRDVGREKSILIAVAVQFFIAAFSTFLLFGLTGLYDPGSLTDAPDADLAYVGPGGFDAYLDQPNLDVEPFTEEGALRSFGSGALDGVVFEHYDDANATRQVTLLLPDGELRAVLLVTQLQGALADYEQDLREARQDRLEQEVVHLDTDVAPERPYGFVHATLLPLLVLAPVFISGAIAGDSFEQELQTKTLLLLRSAPVGPASILAGKLLVPVLLAPLQVLLWVGLLWLNGLPVQNVTWLLGVTAVLALLLSAVGLLVSILVRREHQTQEVYALVALLLGGLSLFLPRDPLNLVARIGAGSAAGSDAWTTGLLAVLAALALVGAVWVAGRRAFGDRA